MTTQFVEQPAQPEQEPPVNVRAWFTIDEINAWADKKLKENPQWSAQPDQEPVAWADMAVRGEDKGLSWTPGHFHKPEALRLAKMIERYNAGVHSQAIIEDYCKAAAELRRLHEVNQELMGALKDMLDNHEDKRWLRRLEELSSPPKREWVGLTADEIWKCNEAAAGSAVEFHICSAHQNVMDFAEAIQAKLKERNE